MPSRNGIMFSAALFSLALVCHAAIGANSDDDRTATHAIAVDANGDKNASLSDFDGDGTVGFSDFLIFAGVFSAREGDEKYDTRYDLNGDGEIGFSDFVVFAQNFGKDAPSPAVAIPDANFRAAIEAALDKANGVPITQADMATLDSLEANDADISDLTGLEFAVNLKWLDLSSNNITDISVLEGLTNLTHLTLSSNDIADLASLVANTGLGTGDTVDLTDNPLNVTSQDTHIPSLRARGVSFSFVALAVTIPDANLRAAIETALSKDSDATITRAEMATMDSLEASDADIDDLTGLESAVNLTFLSLNDNNITNISALGKSINLERLWLSNNSIEDISLLSKLTNLTELWLWNNQIEDISALSDLTGLTQLSLGRNNITDISALSGLTNLKMLILQRNRISDLAPLSANTGLGRGSQVDVTNNPLNAASQSTHIPALQARGVSVSYDVPSPVVAIPDANLRAAIEVALGKASGAPITVAEMERLSDLPADDAGISDLNGLEFAANLWSLWLRRSAITDLSPLSGLTNLTHLAISNLNLTVSDLSPILGLTNLRTLSLRGMNITDISALAGLTNLTSLWLDGNAITDLSPLSGLTNLTTLNLRGNNITDLSTLAANTGLGSEDVVDVRDNPLDAASISTHIPELQANGVNVSFDEILVFTDPQIYNDNVFVLPVSENIAAGNLNDLPLKDYVTRFYEHFNDEFDFLMFVRNLPQGGAPGGAGYYNVKTDEQGIGIDPFFDDDWGSAGKLQGVIGFSTYATYPHTQYGVRWSIFTDGTPLHELMHRWAAFIFDGVHWGFSSANGALGGFDIANLVDHGGGRYTAGNFDPDNRIFGVGPYGPIELYLAGFIPPEEVPDLWVAEDGEWLRDGEGSILRNDNGYPIFTASRVRTYTIEDIIAVHGPRVPDHSQAQKDFRAAVILLISENYPAVRQTLERLSDDVSWLSYAGEDDAEQYNFYEATRGRGTITMGDLSQLRRRSGVKIVVPRSFGMPPPPIVDHLEFGNGRNVIDRTSRQIPAEAEQP